MTQSINGHDIPVVASTDLARIPLNGPALVIFQGLPGAGKSTVANHLLDTRPDTCRRVSRDHLRRMLFNAPFVPFTPDRERLVTWAQMDTIDILLDHDFVALVDDTNMYRPHLEAMLSRCDPIYRTDIMILDFTHIPLDTCIERDAQRPQDHRVGPEVITRMWDNWTTPLPPEGTLTKH